jgi:hypothetical protein
VKPSFRKVQGEMDEWWMEVEVALKFVYNLPPTGVAGLGLAWYTFAAVD